ncbi:cytochrome bd-I oxidase subunit CydX [Paraburkholderia oxyphila]|uniref:cytochrome bd-I oxidase subunit CydX n=1 Tax=Paraburkholderia oxyphila TaxID=614212 RepID=UPI000A00CD8B
MWYFTWILGIGVALGFGIINVLWLDANGKLLDGQGAAASPVDDQAALANQADQAGGAQADQVQERRS